MSETTETKSKKKTAAESELSFESAMDRLEKIVSDLENGKVSLDESLKLYEEGISLVRICSERLDNAERKIKILRDNGGTLKEEDYNA